MYIYVFRCSNMPEKIIQNKFSELCLTGTINVLLDVFPSCTYHIACLLLMISNAKKKNIWLHKCSITFLKVSCYQVLEQKKKGKFSFYAISLMIFVRRLWVLSFIFILLTFLLKVVQKVEFPLSTQV